MNWNCCQSEKPEPYQAVLIRNKHSKVLVGVFEYCDSLNKYTLCTDELLTLTHEDHLYEWCHAKDL
jgi:hypothetical protein